MAPHTSFSPLKDIPDLSGKVILVTGGNSGLGYESIRQIIKHNPTRVYMAARSKEKADAAIVELRKETTDAPISFLSLDLASFDSIKAAAKTFTDAENRLDILLANGGIMMARDGLTKEGYEVHFGTNHMGHALLTQLLLPTLAATAKLSPDVRVVFVSSNAESWAPPDPYQKDKLRTPYSSISDMARYGISKLANIHFAAALAERAPELKVASIHPGIVRTNLQNAKVEKSSAVFGTVFRGLIKIVSTPAEKGAMNQLWASFSPDVKTGTYYAPIGVSGKESKRAMDANLRTELWNWTEEELKPHMIDVA